MLERVGTYSVSQGLLGEYTRIQARSAKWQEQISSGKVGDQYADTKDKASVLVAARQKSTETSSYLSATKEVLSQVDLQDVHLRELGDIATRLRTAVGDALSTGHANAFMGEVQNLFSMAVSVLNTKVGGKYLYGGSRTDQPPVNTSDLNALLAAPAVADVFDNSDLKIDQRIDANETVRVGMTASDIATDLFQAFKDIAAFNAGANGPFGVDVTPAQRTYLAAQNAAMPNVQTGLTTLAAVNGSVHAQVKSAVDRHETMSAYFTKFIGDIEDADLAGALTRLNQDQAAAEAAGRMIAQVNRISLLDFLSS